MKKAIYNIYHPSGYHWVGDGFKGLNFDVPQDVSAKLLDPFLITGFAPPHEFQPADKPRGVGAHPHAGFETVTIVYEGELAHADSAGNRGTITEGGVQWMTAGSGIVHQEFHSDAFTRAGGTLSMSQLWVNLPADKKKAEPGYQDITPESIPSGPISDSTFRVIAGSFAGVRGIARTYSPVTIVDIHATAGDDIAFQLEDGHNASMLIISGSLLIQDEQASFKDLVVFDEAGKDIQLKAKEDSRIVLLSGKPLREPVVQYGPFVATSREDLESLFKDYESGKMGFLN